MAPASAGVLAASGVGAMVAPPAAALAPQDQPNILVVNLDDLRAAGTMAAMPRVAAFFEQGGTSFPQSFAATPLCSPSRASLFTGRYPHNHGVTGNGLDEEIAALDQSATFQGYLQDSGYLTAMAGKYMNTVPLATSPEHWDRWLFTAGGYNDLYYNDDGSVHRIPGYYTQVLGDHATEYLADFEAEDDRPWLMYLAPQAPHGPTTPEATYAGAATPGWEYPASFNEADISDKPAAVRWRPQLDPAAVELLRQQQLRTLMSVDDLVGRVVDELARLGEDERTLAVFTSDNGYSWGEHRIDGKRFAYTDSAVVPLSLRWPGHVPAGAVDDRLVANVDLLPTLLDAAEVSPDLAYPLDGISLLSPSSRAQLLLEYGRSLDAPLVPWASLRTDGEQYVEWYDATSGALTDREFYDLRADPLQLVNLLRDGTTANDPDVAPWAAQLAALRTCAGSSCLVLESGANLAPTARIGAPACSGLACTFSGAASSDPDGSVVEWRWTFGDGAVGSGAAVSHTFPAAGLYPVSLTVVDDQGAEGTTSRDVQVSETSLDFRAATSVRNNTQRLVAAVPAATRVGDALLLFVSANRAAVTVTVPAGWTRLGRIADGTMQTVVWWRVAGASDASSAVAVTVPKLTKLDAQVLAYSGTAAVPVAGYAARAEPGRAAAHTTPSVTATTSGSWLVSYWADKTSAATGWTTPSAVVRRMQSVGTSSGRITSVSGDSGQAVGPGTLGGLTATSSAVSDMATMWSVVLAPAAGPAAATGLVDGAGDAGILEVDESWEAEPVDFDADGDEDVWVGHHDQGAVLWSNDGDGTFTRAAPEAWPRVNQYGRIPDRHDCAWADVDLDGRMDAYCTAGRGTNNPVKYDRGNELWLQTAPGEFSEVGRAWGVEELCGRSHYVAFLDANGDALPDLFVGNAPPRDDPDDPCDDPANGLPSEESKLFVNVAGTALVPVTDLGIGGFGGARCAEVADVDGDGWDDLLVCGNPATQLYLNPGGSGFVDVAAVQGLQPVVSDAVLGDLDGDGDDDLVTSEWGRFAWRPNTDGVMGQPRTIAAVPAGGGGRAVAVGDADGDGGLDVFGVVANATQGTNPDDVLLLNDGLRFMPVVAPAAGGVGDAVATLDVDEDGSNEFLVLNGLEGVGPVQLLRLVDG